jgi:hypothetical protein
MFFMPSFSNGPLFGEFIYVYLLAFLNGPLFVECYLCLDFPNRHMVIVKLDVNAIYV